MKLGNPFKRTTNIEYEKRLKNEFGLTRKGQDWAYFGRGALDENTQKNLHNADLCAECIDYIREQEDFNLICIVPGNTTILSFNDTPPLALASSIQPEEAAKLVDSILNKTKLKVAQYKDSFMLSLPGI